MIYDSYSLMENQLEISFMGSDEKVFSERTVFEGERMPFELFFLVRKGRISFVMNNEETVCDAGMILTVPYDTVYSFTAEAGCEVIWIAADYRVFANLRVFSLFVVPTVQEDPDGSLAALCASAEIRRESVLI